MRLELLREERVPDGVFGELVFIDDDPAGPSLPHLKLATVEDDWRDNAPRISCIPSGLYLLQRTIYEKHGYETFEVTGVSGRDRILIHKANTEEDLAGCIGIGLRRGKIRVARDEDTGESNRLKDAVVASGEAHRQFMERMIHVDEATLEIIWVGGIGPSPVVTS